MPKKDEGETVRIKEMHANYIRKLAQQMDISFLEALYYVINYHRQHSSRDVVETKNVSVKPETQSLVVKPNYQSKLENEEMLLDEGDESLEESIDDVLSGFE